MLVILAAEKINSRELKYDTAFFLNILENCFEKAYSTMPHNFSIYPICKTF